MPEPYYILAELGWKDRSDRTELLLALKEDGYNRLWTDGAPAKIEDVLQGKEPEVAYLLLDRFRDLSDSQRLHSSLSDAFSRGDGVMYIATDGGIQRSFSSRFELDGIKFIEPDDYLFSFNSPLGACPVCGGLGKIIGISEDLVVPDKKPDPEFFLKLGYLSGYRRLRYVQFSGGLGETEISGHCHKIIYLKIIHFLSSAFMRSRYL